ncbi:MAG: LytR C-terminal domain-containing protein [Patescibacteria group bacterium]
MSKSILIYTSLIIVIVTSLFGVYAFTNKEYSQKLTSKIMQINDNNKEKDIPNMIALDTEEMPIYATVSIIPDSINTESVFGNLNKNYQILIFEKNSKIVVVNPKENKIVDIINISFENTNEEQSKTMPEETADTNLQTNEVVNLSDGTTQNEEQTEAEETYTTSITILNGTNTPGMAGKLKNTLENELNLPLNIENIELNDAKGNYDDTVVIETNPNSTKQNIAADLIAQSLNISIASALPELENTPETQLVIIVGEDYVQK